jgi:hypothetical protein
MDSLYFRDPNGSLIELACFKFSPPNGHTTSEVLAEAHKIRLAEHDGNITEKHLVEAITRLGS